MREEGWIPTPRSIEHTTPRADERCCATSCGSVSLTRRAPRSSVTMDGGNPSGSNSDLVGFDYGRLVQSAPERRAIPANDAAFNAGDLRAVADLVAPTVEYVIPVKRDLRPRARSDGAP